MYCHFLGVHHHTDLGWQHGANTSILCHPPMPRRLQKKMSITWFCLSVMGFRERIKQDLTLRWWPEHQVCWLYFPIFYTQMTNDWLPVVTPHILYSIFFYRWSFVLYEYLTFIQHFQKATYPFSTNWKFLYAVAVLNILGGTVNKPPPLTRTFATPKNFGIYSRLTKLKWNYNTYCIYVKIHGP